MTDDIGSGSTSKEAKSGRGSGGSADAKEGTTRADSLPLFRCGAPVVAKVCICRKRPSYFLLACARST